MGLSAVQLASMQQPTGEACDRLAPDVLQEVLVAANKSLNTDAGDAGAG